MSFLRIVLGQVEHPWLTVVISSTVAISVALLGAWLAYHYGGKLERKKDADRRAIDGRMALFTLARQFNKVLQIRKQSIDPNREHPVPFLAVMPIDVMAQTRDRLDFSRLAFLMTTSHADVLLECSNAEDYFDVALQCTAQRNDLLRSQVYPMLNRAGIPNGGYSNLDSVKKALGDDLFAGALSLDSSFIRSVDSAVDKLQHAQESLRDSLKAALSREDFVIFVEGSIDR